MTKVEPTASIPLQLFPHKAPSILFEDPHVIVLSKPAGLLSQGDHSGEAHLVDWLRHYVGRHYIGLIHRLDRNTSGLMIIAKRSKAAQRLTDALQKNQVQRKYLAWIIGHLEKPHTWKHHLEKNEKTNEVKVVQKNGKPCELSVTPQRTLLYQGTLLTLAEFTLETGRSHQIRVQSAFEGFPILGDTKYGSRKSIPFHRTALHSSFLQFPHPMSGEIKEFHEDLPEDLVLSA